MAIGTTRLTAHARQLGFDLVGAAPAHPPPQHVKAYQDWLTRGDHAGMTYMARPDRVARRVDPAVIMPDVRSIVCVAVNYASPPPVPPDDRPRGRITRYAWGADYHDWILERLVELAGLLQRQIGRHLHTRAYVDTGPVLERAFAARAGLGFVGKNTCLISPRLGSWFFLGVLLVDVDLGLTGQPLPPRCGICTRCLDACPTGALTAPYRLDARRCLSYLTIEHQGPIPNHLRPRMGNWIFGCDICQSVCPWQRFAQPTAVRAFRPASAERVTPALADLLRLDEEAFRHCFEGTAILRSGRSRLLRNAAVALGNLGHPEAVPALALALTDGDPLVRGHAAWALGRFDTPAASQALAAAWEQEPLPDVQRELAAALRLRGNL
jgi:epoxyqueuosine reductase